MWHSSIAMWGKSVRPAELSSKHLSHIIDKVMYLRMLAACYHDGQVQGMHPMQWYAEDTQVQSVEPSDTGLKRAELGVM